MALGRTDEQCRFAIEELERFYIENEPEVNVVEVWQHQGK
jgi:antitoxin component HigA of HigAB toxin-antitoxin module